ncbi:MAG TPA: GGDEF domain-containing protein [Stellaceae bacterium]|nr:GGDEF domain-containing protein [Stellaceae bacterium]
MLKEPSKPVASRASRTRRAGDRPAPPSAAKSPGKPGPAADGKLARELRAAQAANEAMRQELEEARARIAQLERLADEDSLAPIANRRAFVRELSRMIGFSQRYNVPSSVIYFDVNGMKQINDTHGHPAGDEALRHVAAILCANVRSSDIVGRLGGDEFGVILAQTTQEQAAAKGLALAQAIGAAPLRWGKAKIAVTAAFGVYSFAGGDDAHVAIEAADRAMYQHKRLARAG